MGFSSQKHTTQDLLYLVPFSLFFLLFRLGSGSLASWDEAIYAAVSKEIVQSGHWLRLTMNGEPWLAKPPLGLWATGLLYQLFGVSELTSRLFSALCGAGCVVATYFLGRRLFSRWVGLTGAAVLLTSSEFIRHSRSGMLDAPLTLLTTLTLLFFWMGQSRNRYLIFSGVTLGLALLTKGFASFLVLPVMWAYGLFAQRLHVLGKSSYWVGVMLAAAIALPWNLFQLFAYRGLFAHESISLSLLMRPLEVLSPPGSAWYFYLRVLVNKYHPWILVGIVSAPYFLFKAFKDRDEESVFLASWMFLMFGALTLFHAKKGAYLMPLYPALSISVAVALCAVFRETTANFVRAMFVVVMALHVPYSHIFVQDYSRPIKELAPLIRARTPEKSPLILYSYHEAAAVSYYVGRPSLYADTAEELASALRSGLSYLVIRQSDMELLGGAAFFSRNHLVQLGSSEEVSFLGRRG